MDQILSLIFENMSEFLSLDQYVNIKHSRTKTNLEKELLKVKKSTKGEKKLTSIKVGD